MATLDKAIQIAASVHEAKTDKAGAPYILHPLRIMMKMASVPAMIVAVLHDVVEDSKDLPTKKRWSLKRLRTNGFSEEVIAAIDGVTDREEQGETYEEFVERAASNPIARQVKIADLEDNMNMLRIRELRQKDLDRLAKYHRSWHRLNETTHGEARQGE